MSALLRNHPGVLVWLLIAGGTILVLSLVALLMSRAGVPLRPIWWFAGFILLIGGPQFAYHFTRALAEERAAAGQVPTGGEPSRAPADGVDRAGANWENPAAVFGADLDPALITDPRPAFPAIFGRAESARFAVLPGDESVLLARFPSAADAEAAWVAYLRETGLAAEAEGDASRGAAVTRSTGDRLYALARGRTLGIWTGPDDAAIRRRMAAGGFRAQPQAPLGGPAVAPAGPDGGRSWSTRKTAVTALVLTAWVFVVVLYFFKGASWAGSAAPGAGVTPASASELRRRLEAVNALDVPFRVEPASDGALVATWRYADAKWIDLARVHGMRRVHRLVLSLDESDRTVRARDYASSYDWSAGRGGAALEWKFVAGITFFEYSHSRVYGLQLDDRGRLTPTLSYQYTFNLQEMKQPLIAAVTGAGWTWRPVIMEGPRWLRWLTE